jgi:uncharacterized membrane protein YraQ (UPF0718 family)
MQKFRVWSILFFLPPLLTAFWLQLYIHVFILIGVIVASFVFHLSKEKKIARVDKFFAWALILSNLSLIASSNFKYPYALLAFAVVPIALAFYYSSRGKTYNYKHGWWHFFSSLITIFSLLTFLR